jgi:hypothetical protein
MYKLPITMYCVTRNSIGVSYNHPSINSKSWGSQPPYELSYSRKGYIFFVGNTPYQCKCFKDPRIEWMGSTPHPFRCFLGGGDRMNGEQLPIASMQVGPNSSSKTPKFF